MLNRTLLLTLLGLVVFTTVAAAAPGYVLTPKVVPVQVEVALTIAPEAGATPLQEETEYAVQVVPMEGKTAKGTTKAATKLQVKPSEGLLRLRHTFEAEQEYTIVVTGEEPVRKVGAYRVYALEPDLFERRPYKGDVHQHSTQSDGRESPARVPAHNRKVGMDFMALTDHRKHSGSMEAIAAWEGLAVDLRIYPGEEVHPVGTYMHIVNFGGREGVTQRFQQPAYLQEVERVSQTVQDLPEGLSPQLYASCVVTSRMIREVGGLSVYCHPYWVTGNAYHSPEALIERLLADQVFVAYEMIGGDAGTNWLSAARYYEAVARGYKVPIVGVTDCHTVTKGDRYTLAFSKSLDLADLQEAIADMYAVAVERVPGTSMSRPYGPLRLVKYAIFLLREVLPTHDALCAEEGALMAAHLDGEAAAAGKLRDFQGRTAKLYERLWAPQAASVQSADGA
ncbi:MAG: hypothetical protein GX100_13240 [candidate division WS1 bacterium]|jgi:predicted metal-dependent phosphoesterase TrpH|nr:hypothetical protein [candidate division WS1 bacterium]